MKKLQCQECKNEKQLPDEEVKVGRWYECDYCGATYEITKVNNDGTVESQMVEEEK